MREKQYGERGGISEEVKIPMPPFSLCPAAWNGIYSCLLGFPSQPKREDLLFGWRSKSPLILPPSSFSGPSFAINAIVLRGGRKYHGKPDNCDRAAAPQSGVLPIKRVAYLLKQIRKLSVRMLIENNRNKFCRQCNSICMISDYIRYIHTYWETFCIYVQYW